MPGMGGIEVGRRIRPLIPNAGIVMITVCDALEEKVRALDARADDYITKPFLLRELLARLRALMRRTELEQPPGPMFLAYAHWNWTSGIAQRWSGRPPVPN
jgi:DNA-binding response OmpR family regulator